MVLASKICSAVLLAGLRLLAGLLPLKVYKKLDKWGREGDENGSGKGAGRKHRIDLLLSAFLCFGAGLLLSTCFIHMIPEVRDSFEKAAKSGNWTILEEFPFAEAIVCLGFFAVYLFEELGHKFMSHGSAKKESEPRPPVQPENGDKVIRNGQSITMELEDSSRSRSSSESGLQREEEIKGHGHQHGHGHSHGPVLTDFDQAKSVTAAIRGFLLVFALSFHSIFEGMAIGLQTTMKDVWFLFAAVTVHELAIMFCIGLEMLASKLRTPVYVAYMVTLGLITPIGVAIGIVITEYVTDPSPAHILTIAILQGIAAGTLLYVTFLEVLERERAKENISGLVKFGTLFLGFVLLSLMEFWGHGDADHGTGESSHVHHAPPQTTLQYSYVPLTSGSTEFPHV